MPSSVKRKEKASFITRFLNGVEWVGNKLPDPAVLFFMMCTISRNDLGHFLVQCISQTSW